MCSSTPTLEWLVSAEQLSLCVGCHSTLSSTCRGWKSRQQWQNHHFQSRIRLLQNPKQLSKRMKLKRWILFDWTTRCSQLSHCFWSRIPIAAVSKEDEVQKHILFQKMDWLTFVLLCSFLRKRIHVFFFLCFSFATFHKQWILLLLLKAVTVCVCIYIYHLWMKKVSKPKPSPWWSSQIEMLIRSLTGTQKKFESVIQQGFLEWIGKGRRQSRIPFSSSYCYCGFSSS